MNNKTWRKRISVWLNRLYLYPPPKPMLRTRSFWVATGLVSVLALAFSVYFIVFTTSQHNAYITNAEDLGIMDQAIWSFLHTGMFHQTICDIVGDTNCRTLAGIPRFAIHFEPILYPISLLYLVFPTPKTLLVLQVLVVASGAFPAFWLARLRLRNEWASVAIATLYLLYPAQLLATVFDFHAVTLTASLLLFVLYFMYTRRTVLLFIFAILALACKEEIGAVVAMYALWSIVFQRRWRSGLALFLLAVAWTGVGLFVVHINSPIGHSLLASRYGALGNSPLQVAKTILLHPNFILKNYVLEHDHFFYLRELFAPTAYLALLAPWIWILALPTLGINLLSSTPNMYSDLYQYDAEIVPVLIFATIEALVLILWAAQEVVARLRTPRKTATQNGTRFPFYVRARPFRQIIHAALLTLLVGAITFSVARADYYRVNVPFSQTFKWPATSAHTALAQQLINRIPPNASVSAQSELVPHMSHRAHIYLFPYADTVADYVFLDVAAGVSPFTSSYDYINEAKSVLVNGHYGIVAAQDGYLLLQHGLPAPGISSASPLQPSRSVDDFLVLPNLPDSFCSYINVSTQEVKNDMDVAFVNPTNTNTTMSLVGYDLDAPVPFSKSGNFLTLTTYWRVVEPMKMPLQILTFMTDTKGKEYGGTTDFPAEEWCQTHTLKPGMLVRFTSSLFNVQGSTLPVGLAHLSIALVPLLEPSSTIMGIQDRLPLHIVSAPPTVTLGTKAVQVMTLPIVP